MLNIIHSTNSDVSSKNFPLLACFAAPSYPCQELVCWGCVGRFEGGENKSSAHDRCCRHGYLLVVVTVANWAAEQMGREVNFFCVKGNWPFAVVNNVVGWWEFKYWLDTHRLLCNTVACSDYSPCTTTLFSIFGCFLFYNTQVSSSCSSVPTAGGAQHFHVSFPNWMTVLWKSLSTLGIDTGFK